MDDDPEPLNVPLKNWVVAIVISLALVVVCWAVATGLKEAICQ